MWYPKLQGTVPGLQEPATALIQSHMNPTQSCSSYFNNIPAGTGPSVCCVFLTKLLCSFLTCPMLCSSCSKAPIYVFFPTLPLLPLKNRHFHFCAPLPPFITGRETKTHSPKSQHARSLFFCKLSGFHCCLSAGSLVFDFFIV